MASGWVKRGLVFAPDASHPWMKSHASVPCVRVMGPDRVRVFFSGRDPDDRSHVGWFDFDPREPVRTVQPCERAALEPGGLGSFDESGAMGSWVLDSGGATWLYYIGWNRGVTVPFYNSIGLARSDDGGETFNRAFEGPIIGRDRTDPYFTASSCVLVEDGAWRMWYVSCTGWRLEGGRPRHYYHIRHATSEDGVEWQRSGLAAIDFEHGGEYAISRPSVVRDGDLYRMWYSFRGPAYRIGYAESRDGIVWQRKDDEAGIDVSPTGWDSEMIEYPCVFDFAGRRYMLYNGNDYGRTGIGLAEAVTPESTP